MPMASFLRLILAFAVLTQLQCDSSSNENCAYFIYESTPYPLNICMTSERTKSVMYRCDNNVISFNKWNSADCIGSINETNYYNASSSFVHNCDGSVLSNAENCMLATLDIWNSPYCFSSPDYELFLVLDVCIPVNHTHSLLYGCNDDAVITQDIYLNNVDCTGSSVMTNSYDAGNNAESGVCFRSLCNDRTYTSNNQSVPSGVHSGSGSGTGSIWSGRRAEEIVFIIAAGSVLLIFWTCYFYRKCCRVSQKKIEQELNEEEDAGQEQKAAYDVLGDVQDVNESEQAGNDIDAKEPNAAMIIAASTTTVNKDDKMEEKNVKLLEAGSENGIGV